MHQLGVMVGVAHQKRNILYHRDFRVDHGVAAADGPHCQLADRQLVADMHRLARRTKLGCGLRIGVERGPRVAFEQRRQPGDIDMVGMLVGDQDGRQAGDPLKTVCERTGVKEDASVIEFGK